MREHRNGRPKSGRALKITAAVVAALILALAVWFVVRSLSKEKTRASELRFDVYSDNVFAPLGDGLASVSGAGIQLLDGAGETYAAKSVMLRKPAAEAAGRTAAAWGIGESGLYVLSAAGIEEITTSGAVTAAAVNSQGYIAAAAEEDGYKGAVTVYNARRKAVYKWYSGSAYIIDVDIADSGDKIAALTLSGTGSRVVLLDYSDDKASAEYRSEDNAFFDIGYVGGTSLCAVSSGRAVFIDPGGGETAQYDYSDGYLSSYSLSGSGFCAFVVGKYRVGGEAELEVLDSSGKKTASTELPAAPDSISAAGKYIAALWADRLVIYKQDLSEYASLDNTEGMQRVIMREDGTAILISGRGAVIFEP